MTFFENNVKIDYKVITTPYEIITALNQLPDYCAYDFETANKHTLAEIEKFKFIVENMNLDFEINRQYLQKINATGLSHPALTSITHLAVGISSTEALVVVCKTEHVRNLICKWLVTTDKIQIWHNSTFDFKHVYYKTKKIPKNFVDTYLLAKSLLNNADTWESACGLKDLMGWKYGDWALDKSAFTLETMLDESKLRYAAIDGCATKQLYDDIMNDLFIWRME